MDHDSNLLMNRMDQFTRIYTRLKNEILQYYELTESAVFLIELIEEETLSLKEITHRSKLSKSTLSRQLQAMVKKKLLIKTTGEDKRYTYYQVSAKGQKAYQNYRREYDRAFLDLLSKWTEEELRLASILFRRLNRSFKPYI